MPASAQSFSSPSSTCQNWLALGSPGSKKFASSWRSRGMLAASNQMMRRSLSLIWPCQHIGGVRIRSPSLISQRRPLTMVAAPSARVAKRIAANVWRCGLARSPGSSTVKAAIKFEVVTVSPPNAGLTRMSARRSTSSIATWDTASWVNGSMSFQRQISGGSLGLGVTGVSVRKRSHSGCRFAASSLATKSEPCFAAGAPDMSASSLRQLLVDIGLVDDDVLDENARLDLVALEVLRQHVDAEPAPQHRVELDRHRELAVLDRAQSGRHAVHAGHDGF